MTSNACGGQRAAQRGDGGVAGVGGDDQLGQHRVVVRADLGAAFDPRFDAHVVGELHLRQQPGRGLEVACRVFGIQAHLDAGAVWLWRLECQDVAARELHHPRHQVDACDLLRHAVFDLQPGVDLEEVEGLGVRIEHELHRTGGAIVHRLAQQHRGALQRLAGGRGQVRCRRLFDHLLIAPLRRAVAFAQGHDLSAAVAEDLDFDMARALHELLDEQAGVLEVGLRQAFDRAPGGVEFGRVVHQPHADATAAGGALQHHRVADAFGFAMRRRHVGQQPAARQQRHAVALRDVTCRVLQAEGAHLRGRRADEGDAGGLAGFGKARVLRQEAVARMDGVHIVLACGREDAVDVEITLRSGGRADAHRVIGHRDVARVAIGFGIDGDALQTQLAQGAQDAAGDSTAVGDQYCFHLIPTRGTERASGCRRCTGC